MDKMVNNKSINVMQDVEQMIETNYAVLPYASH